METLGALLGLTGLLAMLVSFISVVWPLKRLGLPTRKRSALALLLSFWMVVTAVELMPDKPDQPSAQTTVQAEPEPASQPEAPSEPPPPAETTASPEESASSADQEPMPGAKRTSASGPDRIDGDNRIGCRSREYFSKITRIAVQGDEEAWSQALLEGALSGECVIFKADEPVFVSDTALFSGLVKVRRKGKLTEYWTNFESVTH